jgi:hypothetical protein
MNRRHFGRACGAALAAALGPVPGPVPSRARGEAPRDGVLYPVREEVKGDAPKFSWFEAVVERVPKLKNDRGSRWPLITWEGFSSEPQPASYYRQLLDRGLAQHVTLDPGRIETALAIQKASSPVIVMQGASGAFPASLAGEPSNWAHQFDDGYRPKDYTRPCPALHEGWAIFADRLRADLRQFRKRGVRIDAVWLDCENDPLYGDDRHEQARHCKRCRELLPRKVMATARAFMDYTARTYYDLFGAYYAAPVLEVYPKCSVTNWLAQPSTPDEPQPGWAGNRGRVHLPPMVTAWNPTAYGAASWVWKPRMKDKSLRRDQEHVDQVYTNLLLRQVSLTGKLGERWAPEKESIPWVARWLSEPPETEYPVMSRPRYREALRHLWLRGVDGMQVFSPRMKGFEDSALPEVEDAVAAYDEMLAFRPFLDGGDVLNYDVPREQDDGVVWSGLRLGDKAVVRVFKQGGGKAVQTVRPWGDRDFALEATGEGVTYRVERKGTATRATG